MITSIDNNEVREMIARFVDLKTQEKSISAELKGISDAFKNTAEEVIMRNQPYALSHDGRSFAFQIDKTARTTTDTAAVKEVFVRVGLDIAPYQKTQDVQSFSASEHKLFP